MATIKDLKNLDLTKIKTEGLSKQIRELIKGYDAEKEKEDKDLFIEINQKFIDSFFDLTKKNYPDAVGAKKAPSKAPAKKTASKPQSKKQPTKIPDDDLRGLAKKMLDELTDLGIDLDEEDEQLIAAIRLETEEALKETALKPKIKDIVEDYKRIHPQISDEKARKLINDSIKDLAKAVGVAMPRPKADKTETDKEKSKRIMEELAKLEPEIAQCRATIRAFNKKKREAEGRKGKKPKKTRYTLLKERLLSLARLIPDNLKDDKKTLSKTEKILLKTHRELIEAWGMGKVMAEHGENAIKDKFNELEEKGKKKPPKK